MGIQHTGSKSDCYLLVKCMRISWGAILMLFLILTAMVGAKEEVPKTKKIHEM